MKSRLRPITLLFLVLLMGGCSSVSRIVHRQRARSTEAGLTAAGFHVEPANSPDRIRELGALPPLTLVARRRGDETVYVYADPAVCHCEYVGSAEQYAEYRRQRNAAVSSATAREALAAEERIETYDEEQAAWASPWLW